MSDIEIIKLTFGIFLSVFGFEKSKKKKKKF